MTSIQYKVVPCPPFVPQQPAKRYTIAYMMPRTRPSLKLDPSLPRTSTPSVGKHMPEPRLNCELLTPQTPACVPACSRNWDI